MHEVCLSDDPLSFSTFCLEIMEAEENFCWQRDVQKIFVLVHAHMKVVLVSPKPEWMCWIIISHFLWERCVLILLNCTTSNVLAGTMCTYQGLCSTTTRAILQSVRENMHDNCIVGLLTNLCGEWKNLCLHVHLFGAQKWEGLTNHACTTKHTEQTICRQ